MARSVTFAGQTNYRGGGISRISSTQRGRAGTTPYGIVDVIGEADGGTHNSLYTIDDPSEAKDIFKSGPLADAIPLIFAATNDPAIPAGGAFRVRAVKTNAGSRSSIELPGDENVVTDTVAAGSTATVLNLTGAGLTVDAHIGQWAEWDSQRRRITDNDAGAVTVSQAFAGFDPVVHIGDAFVIHESQLTLTSIDYGLHAGYITAEFEAGATTNKYVVTLTDGGTAEEQSGELCGDSFLNLTFTGGPDMLGTGPNTPPITGTITAIASDGSTVDLTTAAAVNEVVANDGQAMTFAVGSLRREIASHTASDAGGVVVITLDTGHFLSSDERAGITLATTTADVREVTAAVGNITGTAGAATGLTSTITQGSGSDNLAIVFATVLVSTITELVEYINSNFNYTATVPAGIDGATLLADLDYGTNNTSVDVQYDPAITAGTSVTDRGGFRRDLMAVVDWINAYSELVTAVRLTGGAAGEGSELPLVTGGVYGTPGDQVVTLAGGARGVSTNATWQTGFDLFETVRGAQVVPLIEGDLSAEGNGSTATWTSVATQLATHIVRRNGITKNEAGGWIGFSGTRAELEAKTATLNARHIHFVGQSFSVLNVDSNVTAQQYWAGACLGAGMRAGSELGESLMWKSILCSDVTQDSGWTPTDLSDVNALVAAGVMFAEKLPNGVIRWVRDITTHLADDLETNIDGGTVDVTRYVAYDLRTYLENLFTGTKVRNGRDARPATLAGIKAQAAARLRSYVEEDILLYSQDPQDVSVTVPGYDRLRVSLNGNVVKLSARIFPAVSIAFELIDLETEIPVFAATV